MLPAFNRGEKGRLGIVEPKAEGMVRSVNAHRRDFTRHSLIMFGSI